MTIESSTMNSVSMPINATSEKKAGDLCIEAVVSYAAAAVTALGIIAIFTGMLF